MLYKVLSLHQEEENVNQGCSVVILTSTQTGPYGFKNRFCFPLIHKYHFTGLFTMKRDFKQKLLKRFSLSWYRNI